MWAEEEVVVVKDVKESEIVLPVDSFTLHLHLKLKHPPTYILKILPVDEAVCIPA